MSPQESGQSGQKLQLFISTKGPPQIDFFRPLFRPETLQFQVGRNQSLFIQPPFKITVLPTEFVASPSCNHVDPQSRIILKLETHHPRERSGGKLGSQDWYGYFDPHSSRAIFCSEDHPGLFPYFLWIHGYDCIPALKNGCKSSATSMESALNFALAREVDNQRTFV